MPEIETAIWDSLRERIYAAADPLEVFMPSSMGEPPVDGAGMLVPFVAVGDIPVMPAREVIGQGGWRYSGTVTLSHVAPIGRDYTWYREQAGKLARWFHEDTRLKKHGICVRITQRGHAAQGYQDRGYWRTPVLFSWDCVA